MRVRGRLRAMGLATVVTVGISLLAWAASEVPGWAWEGLVGAGFVAAAWYVLYRVFREVGR